MMDTERLNALHTAMAEAWAVELREAAKLVETDAAHRQQAETWKRANEHYQASKTAFEQFAEEQALADAKARAAA